MPAPPEWHRRVRGRAAVNSALTSERLELAAVLPYRGSTVEAWLKAHRDSFPTESRQHAAIDAMLDEYRLCADTGQTLTELMEGDPAESV